MGLLSLLNKNDSVDSNSIGKFECTKEKLPELFTQLMDKMGLTNPGAVTSTAGKLVQVTKNSDGTYTIQLNVVQPPLYITWSSPFSIDQLVQYIETVVASKKQVGFFNKKTLSNGVEFCQLGVA